jgi:hypothetical protein
MMCLLAPNANAQTDCFGIKGGSECIETPGNDGFVCIDATLQGQTKASELLALNLIQSVANSSTTPQFLIIKGVIEWDLGDSNNPYNLASGSELIFVDNNSGIQITSGVAITVTSTKFHGCNRYVATLKIS